MISLRKEIRDAENAESRARALAKAFLGLTSALPKAAIPANTGLSAQVREKLDDACEPLKGEPRAPEIEAAGTVAVQQVDEICKSNKIAFEERDAALKEVVETVAWAVNSFKSHGERHKTSLTKLADNFDTLSRVEDVTELRRRLREDVATLRDTVEQMRHESEESVRRLETQVTAFQERVEQARKESGVDRLTGLGSRREAEKWLQKAAKRDGSPSIVLFDIEGFTQINQSHGTMFGDKLLQALTHSLRERFPGEGVLFRWGADEFLALAEGSIKARLDQARGICESFAMSSYFTPDGAGRQKISAKVACGAAQLVRGESSADWYRRARESLEQYRGSLRT
ncbi:MAG TPA: GGDEF domain-containing protein [Bryobacteraceae bacterium]|jgi:diguanylate cyclase (GGDEF)-like protein|nr:GGDEF domain-containing protein [Bryobacteraceae bacterium]